MFVSSLGLGLGRRWEGGVAENAWGIHGPISSFAEAQGKTTLLAEKNGAWIRHSFPEGDPLLNRLMQSLE